MLIESTREVFMELPGGKKSIGRVSKFRDPHGNEMFYATSAVTDGEGVFFSASGAAYAVELAAMLGPKAVALRPEAFIH